MLANGLSWYLRPTRRPDDRIVFRLVVAVGASDESDGERGWAHFVEHMAFNGIESYPGNALDDFILSRGRDLELNGFTYPDYTVYLLELPSGDPEVFEVGLGILSRWASGILFDPAEVEREKGVIRAEMREIDTLEDRLRQIEDDILYAGTPFADREVLGTPESTGRADARGLKDFYARLYRPGRMAVIVTGPVRPAPARAALEKVFSAMVGGRVADSPRALKYLSLPDSLRVARSEDSRRARTELRLLLRERAAPARSGADALREYRAGLAAHVLAGRLEDLGAGDEVPWIYLGAGRWEERGGERAWYVSLSCPPGAEIETLRSLGRELGALSSFGARPFEAEIAADDALAALPSSDPDGYEAADSALRSFLYGDATLDPDFSEALESRLRDTVLAEGSPPIGTSEGELPSPEAGVLSVIAPGRLSAADAELLEAYRDGLAQGRAGGRLAEIDEPWAGLPEPGAEEGKPAAREKAAARTVREDGTVELVLSNGVRVLLGATDSGEGWAYLGAWSPGGLAAVPAPDRIAADEAPGILQASGFPAGAPGGLRAELAGTGMEWRADVVGREEFIETNGSSDCLESLFRLLASSFTRPRMDSDALKKAAMARAEELRLEEEPESAFLAAVDEALGLGVGAADPVVVEALSPAEIQDAWNDRFGDPSDFTFFVAGDFSLGEAERLASKYLSGLSAGERRESPPPVPAPPAPGLRIVHGGSDLRRGRVVALWPLRGLSEEEAARMGDLAESLEPALFRGLREERAATYDVYCSWNPACGDPGSGEFRVEFEAAPDRARSLVGDLSRELKSFAVGTGSEEREGSRPWTARPDDWDMYLRLLAEARGPPAVESPDAPYSGDLARLAADRLAPESAVVFVLASE